MIGRFQGKVVVITGAAGGIGTATATRFGQEGARIVAVDLAGPALDQIVDTLRGARIEAVGVATDVTDASQVAAYVAAAQSHFGGIDILFNNAGVEGAICPSTDYPEDVFERVLSVNVKGVWLGMKYAVPAMRLRGGGAIVNTASTAGLGAAPNIIAYGASKHAVIGMTQTMAIEHADDHIRVNAVCPGPIETRMMRALEQNLNREDPDAVHRALAAGIPMGRYGEPAEVAALVTFLASDDAAYITGGIFTVDGGSSSRSRSGRR
jgi:NAD(P)-dependent dehydrogenase (short-subunit alcohol dehydrogenase family)